MYKRQVCGAFELIDYLLWKKPVDGWVIREEIGDEGMNVIIIPPRPDKEMKGWKERVNWMHESFDEALLVQLGPEYMSWLGEE